MKSEDALERDQFCQKLGERLRHLREKNGISLRDFETYDASMDRHALSRIENGLAMPSTYTLYRIARVIGVKLSDVLKDIE